MIFKLNLFSKLLLYPYEFNMPFISIPNPKLTSNPISISSDFWYRSQIDFCYHLVQFHRLLRSRHSISSTFAIISFNFINFWCKSSIHLLFPIDNTQSTFASPIDFYGLLLRSKSSDCNRRPDPKVQCIYGVYWQQCWFQILCLDLNLFGKNMAILSRWDSLQSTNCTKVSKYVNYIFRYLYTYYLNTN